MYLDIAKMCTRFQPIYILVILPIAYKYGYSDVAFIIYMLVLLFALLTKIKLEFLVDLRSFLIASLLLVWYVIEFIVFDFQGLSRLVQIICVFLTVIINQKICWSRKDYLFLRNVAFSIIVISIVWIPITGFNLSRYMAYFSHSNFLGSIMFHIFIILVFVNNKTQNNKKVNFLISCGAVLFLVLVSDSRSSLVSIIVFVGIVWWDLINRNSKSNNFKVNVALIVSITFSIVFTIVYPKLVGTSLGMALEMFSRQYLDKNFFSGRQVLWNSIINKVGEAPFGGHGLAAVPSMYMDTSFSSHNLWLQLVLQTGFVGLVLFLMFGYILYKQTKNSNDKTIGCAYICAIIIHECFEVTLTQNEFATGIIFWMLIGIITNPNNRKQLIGEMRS